MTPFNPTRARDELQSILSKKEYKIYYKENQNHLTQLWNHLKQEIQNFLQKFFPTIHISGSTSQWVLYVVVGLILLFLIFLIFKLWANFTKTGRYRYRKFSSVSELAQTVAIHLKKADDLAGQGDYKRATRHTFLALILHLNETGSIEAKPWKTNFEYALELEGKDDERSQHFTQLALFFDEIVYGNHPIQQEGYLRFLKNVTRWINPISEEQTEGQGGSL